MNESIFVLMPSANWETLARWYALSVIDYKFNLKVIVDAGELEGASTGVLLFFPATHDCSEKVIDRAWPLKQYASEVQLTRLIHDYLWSGAMKLVYIFLGWLWICLLIVPFSTAQVYTITDLGALDGSCCSAAYAINFWGTVSGSSSTAFLWNSVSGLNGLGTLPGGTFSAALAINNFNQVAGYSNGLDFDQHAFLWTSNTGMQDLGTLRRAIYSEAFAVNDAGVVVGDSASPNGFDHAFRWTARYGMKDIGTLPFGTISRATGINYFEQIVGYSTVDEIGQTYHAFFFQRGNGMNDLGTLPGDDNSFALGINIFGQVVGESVLTGANNDHAVLWTENQIQDLGLLPTGSISVATAINDVNQVVGYADYGSGSGSTHAFVWSNLRGMQDLNDLISMDSGWTLLQANALNVYGQIVGVGVINNQPHAFLLSPGAHVHRRGH